MYMYLQLNCKTKTSYLETVGLGYLDEKGTISAAARPFISNGNLIFPHGESG